MWIEFLKIVVSFYFCSSVTFGYYHDKYEYIRRSENNPTNYLSTSVSGRIKNNDSYIIRQSRYPNFEKVMTRIENMNVNPGSSKPVYKLRHKGWSNYRPTTSTTTTTTTDDGLFETYGDLEDDDFEDYDDSASEDDEFIYDTNDDFTSTEDPIFDTIDNVQAEEPTERSTSAPVSSMTELKWKYFGNRQAVEESRQNQINFETFSKERGINAALENYVRMRQQGKCRNPLPRVISIQKEYPDPSKTYTPHCTVLHRCAEDTGCCGFDSKCQYKIRELVHLYFYTRTFGSTENKVEKLSFYNDTECECRQKSTESTSTETATESNSGLSFRSATIFHSSPPQEEKRCNCPKHFESKTVRYHDKCSCDCEEDNLDCIQLKKGKEHLSMIDRICILNNECEAPVCEYGAYMTQQGKCPSKKEKIEDFRRIRINH